MHQRGLLAVTADKEWNAIRAADALKVTWSTVTSSLPDQARLYDDLRTAPSTARKEEHVVGDVAAAMSAAAKVVEATYEWPFQSHASMVGACAVADVRPDGATLWTGTQKPHFAQAGAAKLLGLPLEAVRAIWTRGPGSYGRNDAGDASMDAAFLSRATGRPVRVQYMRATGTGWDPKGPASGHLCKAALDASGAVTAYHFESRGFSRTDLDTNESDPRDTLPGQLLGLGQHHQPAFGTPAETYTFPAQLIAWETVAPLVANASPLRTAHRRDPVGPQINFASESFIDELAAAAGAHPDRVPPAPPAGPARHRRDQGGGGGVRLAAASRGAAGAARRRGARARHRAGAARGHAVRRYGGDRSRSPHRRGAPAALGGRA